MHWAKALFKKNGLWIIPLSIKIDNVCDCFFPQLPAGVTSIFYEGNMEQVEFDDKPMGLWNFVYGENNYLGAAERFVYKLHVWLYTFIIL